MMSKVIILVIFIVLLIAQVVLYSKKTKNSTIEVKESVKEKVESKVDQEEVVVKESSKKEKQTGKSKTTKKSTTKSTKKSTGKRGRPAKNSAAMAKENSETLVVKSKSGKKANIWPFAIIFDLVLICMAISVFDWNGLFEISWFQEATDAVTTYEIFGFEIFGKLLGSIHAFGEWSLGVEMAALIMIATCILALVYRVKWNDFIDGVCDGFRRALEPAVVILLTYVVLVIVTYHPFQLTITKFLLDITSGINVVTMTLVSLLSSLFNVDLTYVTQSTLPYVQTVITDSSLYPLIGVIFQSIYGLTLLVAPTSFILMGTLSYLDVSYKQWLKHIWKLFLTLLAILVVIFLIILAL